MQFIEGWGWKACFDEEKDLYTAKTSFPGAFNLYQISRETYDALSEGVLSDEEAYCRIHDEGRHLYMDVDDRCGPPYSIVFDDEYMELCPWTEIPRSEYVWSEELTDAVVEIFASESDNREQRRKKREARKKK